MHISEGVLSVPILAGGALLAAAGTAIGLRRLDWDRLIAVAILSAAFFVGSLIHVPVGLSNAHLILNGLIGAALGWASFPAILVGLFLQAVLFQYGGITALGANTCTMAVPAVACYYLFRPLLAGSGKARTAGAFCCGAGGVLLASLLTAASLALADEGFLRSAQILVLAHVPVMLAEGFFTVLLVAYLAKAQPGFFAAGRAG